jgi:hypothetical protein
MSLANNSKDKENEENNHSRIERIQTQRDFHHLFKQESKMQNKGKSLNGT